MFNLDGMLNASGSADMPGSEALLELHPDEEPSDEHVELLFLDCETGEGVPSV